MTEYIPLTETSRLAVSQDEDAHNDDPRSWTPEVQVKVYATSDRHNIDPLITMSGAGAIFADHMVGANATAEVALAFAKQWIRKHGSPEQIDLFHLHGYTQSDWWDVVVVTPDEGSGTPQGHATTFEAWSRGDVYTVDLERRASWARITKGGVIVGGDQMQTWEEAESVGSCYLTDTYTAQTVALEHWGDTLTDDERTALEA